MFSFLFVALAAASGDITISNFPTTALKCGSVVTLNWVYESVRKQSDTQNFFFWFLMVRKFLFFFLVFLVFFVFFQAEDSVFHAASGKLFVGTAVAKAFREVCLRVCVCVCVCVCGCGGVACRACARRVWTRFDNKKKKNCVRGKQVFETFPDARWTKLTHLVDEKSQFAVSSWTFEGTDKASGVKTIADGVDVLTFNQDGKITRKNAFRKPVVVQK